MFRAPLTPVILVVSLVTCGGGDTDPPTDDLASDTPQAAWTVTVESADGAPDLPDIEGDDLDAIKLGTALQLSGIDADHALVVSMTVGDELETGEYGPSTFSITWPALDHTCVAGSDGVTISVEEIEPVRGTFSGLARCYAESNPTEAFEVQVSGTFRDSV